MIGQTEWGRGEALCHISEWVPQMGYLSSEPKAICIVPERFYDFGIRAEDEIIRIDLQHDAEGELCPHAELLHVAFAILQPLILADLDIDQGSDLLLGQALGETCLAD